MSLLVGGVLAGRTPTPGSSSCSTTKNGGPKHWKILHEGPQSTAIGPLWDPQYYFTAGKRWTPQTPDTLNYLDLEAIGARVPDEQFKPFLSFMESEELKLSTYEQVWPWLYSPATDFISKVPDVQMGPQLGLFSPSMPLAARGA